jgi:hypothetical protein
MALLETAQDGVDQGCGQGADGVSGRSFQDQDRGRRNIHDSEGGVGEMMAVKHDGGPFLIEPPPY